MRRIIFIGWLLLLAASLFAAPKNSDKWGELLRRYGDPDKVHPGAWASYKLHTIGEDGKPETLDWKMSCVGTEKVDDQDGIWLEMEMEMPKSDKRDVSHMIMKTLVLGATTDKQTIETMIIQADDQPPMEMHMGMGMDDEGTEVPEIEELGKETVKVPAGTFTCQHFRTTTDDGITDLYISDEASLYGMVKMESGESKMELVDHGKTGAVSQIKGEPVNPMDMQQIMKNMKDLKPPEPEKEGK
ncbi:DUF3108 domain-containing protein [bacterium]|nr:DUF3108 domain-containing protein [bacterium]